MWAWKTVDQLQDFLNNRGKDKEVSEGSGKIMWWQLGWIQELFQKKKWLGLGLAGKSVKEKSIKKTLRLISSVNSSIIACDGVQKGCVGLEEIEIGCNIFNIHIYLSLPRGVW